MPATFFLATDDPDLLRAWWLAIPPGRSIRTWSEIDEAAQRAAGTPWVVVYDAAGARPLPASLEGFPRVRVGLPDDGPSDALHVSLSYDESRERLAGFLPLLETLATHVAAEETASAPTATHAFPTRVDDGSDEAELVWELAETLAENLDSAERLRAEVRRVARRQLQATEVLFFEREGTGFSADRPEWSCAEDDPLCRYLARFPGPIDGQTWPQPATPAEERAVRTHLSRWVARLLVPQYAEGKLRGFLVLGPRTDGYPYSARDRRRAASLARLFRLHADRLQARRAEIHAPGAAASQDLSLALSHELGNALVSLAAFRHRPAGESLSPVLLGAMQRDIARLEALNRHLAVWSRLAETPLETIDLRATVRDVGRAAGLMVELPAEPAWVRAAPGLVAHALLATIEGVAETRSDLGKRDLVVRLKAARGAVRTEWQLALVGDHVALEGIWPPPIAPAAPWQGRIGVWLAKEIIRRQGGAVFARVEDGRPRVVLTFLSSDSSDRAGTSTFDA